LNREVNNPNSSIESGDYTQIAYALAVSLGQKLTHDNYTLATAESCTGGQLSAAITSAAGASAYFNVGVCTYSNESKIRYCSVKSSTISLHGAVSAQVAEEMANGIRVAANSTYGLATTGIAGPTGGSLSKPIGTVFLGLSTATKTEHLKLSLTNLSRTDLTACSTIEALKFVLSKLK
jgi:nicotinamide-nucleotide amidase